MAFWSSRTKVMSKTSCPNSISMPRETIRPKIGTRRLPQFKRCIPKATNYNPTTAKQINATCIPQVALQEHITWRHEDPHKDLFTHDQLTIVHYTTHHGPYMDLRPVTHQDLIHTRDFYNQFTDITNGRGTDRRTQTHK